MTAEKLFEITHLKRKKTQVEWFRQHLGVDVPHDRFGVILSDESYEKLLEKRLGIRPSSSTPEQRPAIRLVNKKKE